MNTCYAWSIGLLVIFSQATEAQWKYMDGPWGGWISCFAMGSGAIIAGSMDDGVFRSMDGGMSWTPVNSGIPVTNGGWRSVSALAAHDNVFFAGSGESGVLRSTDNGSSWTPANSGITRTDEVQALLASDRGIYTVVEGRFFRSIDDGQHWTRAGGDFTGSLGLIILAKGNSLFLGTRRQWWGDQLQHGIWLSTNNGETWTPIDSGLPNMSVFALAADDGAVFASTDSGVFRSTDNGASWTAVNSGITGTSIYDQYFPLLRSGTSLFAATDSGVFHSTNQGESWTKINSGLSQFGNISLAASNDTLFAGTISGGIFRSTDNGSNWDPINSGVRSTKLIRTLSVAGGILLAGWGSGIFTSADSGLHWNDIASGFANDPEALYHSFYLTQGGAVIEITQYKSSVPEGYSLSTTGGASWTRVESGLTDYAHSFASLPNGYFIGTQKGVIRSTDSGRTWSGPDSSIAGNPVYSLTEKSGTIVGGSDGGVFVSSDSGKTWEKTSFGLMSAHVEALATCGDALFAGSSYGGVFRSDDNGDTWKAANTGLANTSVFSLISHDSTLFAGTYGSGVFMSNDNGITWKPFNTGIPEMRVYSLAVSGGELFAGTENYGIWQRPLSDAGVIPGGRKVTQTLGKSSFHIEVPGIAHPRLAVEFSLSNSENVNIALYTLSGKEILTLLKNRIPSGPYRFNFDIRNVARGCYAVRLQAGNAVNTKVIHIDR
jgi:photosystem II stability/assembly factor-like uncharacterized protein